MSLARQLAVLATLLTTGSAITQRPHVVLIMVDDMGFSDIGCYGSEIETPNLDALAAGGVRFSQFYNSARCCPTRASLLTGLHPHQTGIGHMTETPQEARPAEPVAYQGYLNRRCVTLAEVLGAAGYGTYMAGKWHVGMLDQDRWPLQRGFDRFWGVVPGALNYFAPEHPRGITADNEPITRLVSTTERRFYTTDAFTDHAIGFVGEHLDGARKDDPFFLYLAYNAPHWPIQAHEEDIAKYRGKYRIGWDELRQRRLARQIELGLIDPDWQLTERDPKVPAWDSLDEDQQDEMDLRMAIYAAMIDRVDQNVGKLVAFLRERGILDDTLILFLSDNGACAEGGILGNHDVRDVEQRNARYMIAYGGAWANASNTPFRRYKHWSHEGGVATPFFAHWPNGIDAHEAWETQPAQLLDVMPTLVELAETSYPTELAGNAILPMEGVSLVPAFRGQDLARSRPMFVEHEGHGFVRDGRWKLVALKVARNDGYHPEAWELYDMLRDRTETTPLNDEFPAVVERLGGAWKDWSERVGVFPRPGAK